MALLALSRLAALSVHESLCLATAAVAAVGGYYSVQLLLTFTERMREYINIFVERVCMGARVCFSRRVLRIVFVIHRIVAVEPSSAADALCSVTLLLLFVEFESSVSVCVIV